jgi:hypothetical protein
MAHYAFLNSDNIVTEVIVGKEEYEDGINWEEWYENFRGQKCRRTSYNTIGGNHNLGGTPFRKNFASVGYIYDDILDAFYAQCPGLDYELDKESCLWIPKSKI